MFIKGISKIASFSFKAPSIKQVAKASVSAGNKIPVSLGKSLTNADIVKHQRATMSAEELANLGPIAKMRLQNYGAGK